MRYHIDTIPVWDAMKLNSECPLCSIRRNTECMDIHRFLGASVMEPDTRILVNDKGFCMSHQAMLFREANKLGHALMMHTHMMDTEQKLNKLYKKMLSAVHDNVRAGFLRGVTGKNSEGKKTLTEACHEMEILSCACVICDSLRDNLNRYAYTFLHLWKTDDAFQKAFTASKGLCVPHTALLIRLSSEILPADRHETFIEQLVKLQTDHLKRLEEELHFFTKKFDYRNQNIPWGENRNAVERSINALQSQCVGEASHPKEKRHIKPADTESGQYLHHE